MYCLLRRCMSVLLALVFVGGLAACSTTTTGSDASRESSIATPAPVEPDTAEAFEEPEQAQAMAEPAEPQVRAEPAAAGEEMDTAAAGVTAAGGTGDSEATSTGGSVGVIVVVVGQSFSPLSRAVLYGPNV